MARRSITAQRKKDEKLNAYDEKQFRTRALWHYHKPTKAEKYFWHLFENEKRAIEQGNPLSKKDIMYIHSLDKEFYALQAQINDENNVDVQDQRTWIQQQHDILEEQEKIYNKYYEKGHPKKSTNNKR